MSDKFDFIDNLDILDNLVFLDIRHSYSYIMTISVFRFSPYLNKTIKHLRNQKTSPHSMWRLHIHSRIKFAFNGAFIIYKYWPIDKFSIFNVFVNMPWTLKFQPFKHKKSDAARVRIKRYIDSMYFYDCCLLDGFTHFQRFFTVQLN